MDENIEVDSTVKESEGLIQQESLVYENQEEFQEIPIKANKRNKRTGLIILSILVGLCIITGIIKIAKTGFNISYGFSNSFSGFSSNDYIAVLHIEGTIEDLNETYDQEWLLETISSLAEDEKNRGIMLFINSPGGGVYQSDEAYLELMEYKNLSGKPVWAYFGSMAASGGYYIGCAADRIYANRNTLTGSIGVIAGQSFDLSKLMEKHGIEMYSFIAGRNKDMLNINVPVTPEQRQIMQSIADECYDQFTNIVAQSRNMPLTEVVELSDGRIYTAKQALENGLIDGIERFDDALNIMELDCELFNVDYVDFYPETNVSFINYLLSAATDAVQKIFATQNSIDTLVHSVAERTMPDIPYPAYFYYR